MFLPGMLKSGSGVYPPGTASAQIISLRDADNNDSEGKAVSYIEAATPYFVIYDRTNDRARKIVPSDPQTCLLYTSDAADE